MTKVKTAEEFFNSFTTEEVKKEEKSVDEMIKEEFAEEATGTELVLDKTKEEEYAEKENATEVSSEEEKTEEAGEELEDKDELLEFEEERQEEEVLDFSAISKEIGLGEDVKDKATFVAKYNEKLKAAKEDALADLPDELKEAIEFFKQGGDYKAILDAKSIDYDRVSTKELVRASVEKYFKNDDGTLDEESLNEWFDSKSKAEINIMGDQIREKLKAEQALKINQVKQSVSAEKEKSNQALKAHINSIESIGGVKISQSDKDTLFNDTVQGIAIREMFYGEDGKISQKKLAENLFKVRKFEKAIALAKSNAKTEGKREVLAKVTNSSVKKAPGVTKSETKPVTPLDEFYSILTQRK